MTIFAKILMALSALALLLYPLWGMLSPESYALELTQHHAYGENYTLSHVSAAAGLLWISNSVLAAAFLAMMLFVGKPNQTRAGMAAGWLLVLYPFVRSVVEVQMAKAMMASEIAIELSSEKAFFIVFGFALLAIASQLTKQQRATP